MTHPFDMLHAIAGLLVGVLVGLTGVGGGSLMTPLLVLMFGVNPQTAVGTDLLFAAITKIGGSVVHGKRETVDWAIVRRLATGSIPAAIVTLVVLAYVGKIGKSTENVILFSLALLLFVTAVAVASRKWLMRFVRENDQPVPAGKVAAGTIILGAVIGLAVSISSVGAGAIGVTVLLLLYPRLPVARLVGSDIAHAVPLALIAGTGHWIIGDVNLVLLGNLLIGSIPGVIVGSYLSSHAPDKVLQPLLACVLAVSSWQLMVKSQMADKVQSPIEAVAKEPVH
ncbi:sulfite exporter TauE/SafE family protein [Novosphingobium sp. BL-8A]|uniref:sulfite exporter TauE/SafE family protein n=1 Tax=Novosphingobium sp. BL-8A TaxID=3127639 RepID=UPI0037576A7F